MPSLLKEGITLTPFIASSREELGRVAARDIAEKLRERLAQQRSARIIFAAAPSQTVMLEALAEEPGIDWTRITAFHMDEYLGLAADAPQRFSAYLRRTIFDRVPFGAVHLIEPGTNPQAVVDNYTALLGAAPIDLLLCGIGSNGHLAFNDPPALFEDPADVKIVQLDDTCRQQQVDDLCFERFSDVPTEAITLSIPRLLRCDEVFCCVPGMLKADAVRDALEGLITELCPASILRLHPSCKLYLDRDSASKLTQ
jgi:glucosamine-6-phosphate deaminase